MNPINEAKKGRMVVAVDNSPGSIAALTWAANHALRFHMYIEVVSAWDYQFEIGETMAPGLGGQAVLLGVEPKLLAEQQVNHALSQVFCDGQPFDLITKVMQGDPVSVLVEESKGAELVVVGSRSHGPLLNLFLGSVSEKIAIKSHCPVVIVHPKSEVHGHE